MTPAPQLYWPNLSRRSVYRQRAKEIGIALGLSLAVSLIGCMKADAKPHRHHHAHRHGHHHVHHVRHHRGHRVFDANGNGAQVIGHRPEGCPHAWCGCGLARYLGLNDRRLWLAASWSRLFPRTDGHAGAVGVAPSRHHVVLVEQHIEGTRYLVRDFNGGRGLAWLRVRDLRGFVFVDPRQRSAQQLRAYDNQS